VVNINVSSNIARVKATVTALSEGIETRAIVRALNRAGDQAMTEASRLIRAEYNIKANTLRKQMKVRARARPGSATYVIRVFGGRIPLIEFGARGTRSRGVSVRVKKGGGRERIARAFIAKMKSGHIGVFARVKQLGKLKAEFRYGKGSRITRRGSDLPIQELYSLDTPTMFMRPNIQRAVGAKVRESFEKNFADQIKLLQGRYG
jgi:Prophage minor tail protein Z (GPZ)